MKSNYLLILFLFISSFGFAQGYDVGGVVKETGSGLPIPGVNVQVKNSTIGTATDMNGRFSLKNVTSGATLIFSYLGYKNLEYKVISNNSALSITLQEDSKLLDEVVVIGYGSQKKREVTGAVSVVDSKTLEALKPVKIEQALQGTVSGVNVTTTSGAPGAALDIRIRGIATNGDNRPLTIIDGYIGELGLLNPNDVDTITVLKDAQAAIYGSAGANGVILITTKMGKKNSKARINYNTYTGFQETSRTLPMLNATEYALLLNESYANGGNPIPFPNVSGLGKGTNWQNEVFSTSVPIINHDISFSGGSDKITYSISGSHLDQEGIIGKDKSGFLRNTARVSLSADVSDKLKLKTNVIYTYFNRKSLNESGLGSVLFNALNTPATLNPYDVNGDFTLIPSNTGLGIEIINPLAQIANTYNDYNFKKVNGNFGLDYKLFNDFTISSSIGFNTSNSESKSFSKEINYGGKVFDVPRSSVSQSAINDNDYSFDLFGTYAKKIGEDHNLVTTVGNTIFKQFGNGLFATGFDVPYNSWEFADISLTRGIAEVLTNGSYNYDERRLSYFARAQYDYKGKYLFSAMIRRDASTKFGPGNKVGYFPSFTAGWLISDEGFFGDDKIINFMKLRGSYGTLGNDQIPNNGYVSQLSGEATYVFDGALVNGLATGQIPNPNLKWEEARKFDVGLDLKLIQNKVSIVADYFIDTRADLLIPFIPVSGINGTAAPGAGSPTINAGTVRNSGLEFAIDYKNKFSDNFSMSVGYNVTFLKNEVLAVNNGIGYIEGGSFGVGQQAPSRMEVGKPIGYFYGYKSDGIFQNQAEVDAHPSQISLGADASPGDLRFVDVNGDGILNSSDRTNIGDPIPDATMGFNLQMNYKDFDFAVYTFASVGNDMVRNYERNLTDVNRLNYVLDRWTGEGSTNTTPRVTTSATGNSTFSSYFVEDASYLRIQNMQLGYSINSKFSEKAGITKLRLYAGVNNLYTFTKYKGFDPGASSGAPIGGGIDFGFYPIPRTYLLGLNINF
ncbi:SusC/RagA family TonB-linked outer membrane protein [Flavobacterium glaciei]|uniref:TonB-linked SusC/RagA family outer membrane protein n=1 Tax=Flavobacterium glaciei TaxID=386300 RepID=A0A562PP89_9FLAO|nr:TonB-dependent receptor [Flavobacterium glaciei]RDI52430.1 TonB-linked SusC/RagA family outer membrane protein [Flavobacterium glaciei]TWI46178.1 TonB-linked SusC/RagA family outer membrane protein [Flavobacterium glaciei]